MFSAPVAVAMQVLLTADVEGASRPPALVNPLPVAPLPATSPPVEGAPRPRPFLGPIPGLAKKAPAEQVYKLREAKDGTGELVYDAESGFTARVARDGSVRFVDKHVTALRLFPFLPTRNVNLGVPSLQSSLKFVLRGRTPSAAEPPDDGSPPPETTALIPEVSRYRPDPREGCRYCGTLPPVFPSVMWRADITDEIMRMNGQDPYRYQKAKFLVATRELRSQMGAKAHAENIRDAITELPARLVSIACDARVSLRDRRALLEALRAELDTGTPAGRLAAGRIDTFLASRFGQPDMCAPVNRADEPAQP